MREIIVIGAGASGLMAAATAAQMGARVTVLEKMPRPGRKLLLTGNGKCNVTNLASDAFEAYRSSDAEALAQFTNEMSRRFSAEDTTDFFRENGLLLTSKGDLVYPASMQAAAVLDVLLAVLSKLGVKMKYATPVTGLSKSATGRWQVATEGWTYEADRVILAAGSQAVPATGSDGSGYALARQTGHPLVSVLPALTGLKCRQKNLISGPGVRTAGTVELHTRLDGQPEQVYRESGEIQWAPDGISGIVVFNLSRFAANALDRGGSAYVRIDVVPQLSEEALAEYLAQICETFPGRSIQEILTGLIPDRLIPLMAPEPKKAKKKSSPQPDPAQIAHTLKQFRLDITGTRGFDQCQVCSGGVALSSVDPATMESRTCSGLYFAGEILDADGPCGGYNLQWAWSCGRIAGESAAKGE